MDELSADNRQALRAIAERNDIAPEAVKVLFDALRAGGGAQAQFNHPDLGGMGQWSRGGMLMIGDMFNGHLKARVGAICTELAELVRHMPQAATAGSHQSQTQGGAGQGGSPYAASASRPWWPEELGQPASTGAQNSLRYAVFPRSHRLAIDTAGQIAVYDTGDHQITGFSQQQSGDQSITFTSQHGPVRVTELTPVGMPDRQGNAARSDATAGAQAVSGAPEPAQTAEPAPATAEHDIFEKIERLSGLHAKGVLTDDEYQAKEAELLARL
jgi:hypothetical protein